MSDNDKSNPNISETLHPQDIDRDEDGKFGSMIDKEYEISVDDDNSFWGHFPQKCITAERIRKLFSFPEDKYEKYIGLCMFLAVAAVFNPTMLLAFAFINGGLYHLVFVLMMFVFFMICLLALDKRFSLVGMGIVSVLKIYPFSEAASDTFFSVAMMMMCYLLHRLKKKGV